MEKGARAERDKRLRPEGNEQYIEIKGLFAEYLSDPYMPVVPRAPKTDHVTFAFIGGGFSGLLAGARLAQADVTDVRILDKAGDFGGTWYWNRYPGAQCDTASMIYLPLLEETGHQPTEKYVHAPEILEHCRRIGRQFGLYDKALFHTQAKSVTWDEGVKAWRITTDRGDNFTAQFIGLGTGPLHVPKLPGIPGIKRMTVYGDPSKPGPYVIRVKFEPGTMSMPHFHPEDRLVTVLKGTWWTGKGKDFTPASTDPIRPGGYMLHPAGAAHFDGAKDEEVILQIAGVGPSGTEFIKPDLPRTGSSR